jgi:hypothetical protein
MLSQRIQLTSSVVTNQLLAAACQPYWFPTATAQMCCRYPCAMASSCCGIASSGTLRSPTTLQSSMQHACAKIWACGTTGSWPLSPKFASFYQTFMKCGACLCLPALVTSLLHCCLSLVACILSRCRCGFFRPVVFHSKSHPVCLSAGLGSISRSCMDGR